MDLLYFIKIAHVSITWWYRQLAGCCSAQSSYKTTGQSTILILGIHCDKIWYHSKNTFFVQKTFLLIQKNVFSEREAHFEIEKIKNTLRFPLFLKIWLSFFVLKIHKIIKKTLCFTSKSASHKSLIWRCYGPRSSNH